MNTECLRIADQLRRAYEGKAWHGPCLRDLLAGVDAKHAAAHPVEGAHSIWELVSHIGMWNGAGLGAIQGNPMPQSWSPEQDFPPVATATPEAWRQAQDELFAINGKVCKAIEAFDDARLNEIVPGRKYNYYFLLHGLVQHALYHGGQIALLKKK